MSVFRQEVLNSPIHNKLSTLRYKFFAIGTYIVKDGNKKILKLSLAMERRRWFDGLRKFAYDFAFPIAY